MPAKKKARAATDMTAHENEEHVLRGGTSSFAKSIIGAIVIKDEDLFFLAAPSGDIPLEPGHGLGLYYHDCRFLNGYELKIGGFEGEALIHRAAEGARAAFEISNPDLTFENGGRLVKQTVGLHWERVIDHESLSLRDRLTFRNFGQKKARIPFTLNFSAHFEDVFEIRRVGRGNLGQLHKAEWKGNHLRFEYSGKDGIERGVTLSFSTAPKTNKENGAEFEVEIAPAHEHVLDVTIHLSEGAKGKISHALANGRKNVESLKEPQSKRLHRWHESLPQIKTSNPLFNDVLYRSFSDLHMLKSRLEGEDFFSAGVPWYVALFGRDSIVSSLMNLSFMPQMAAHTLRLLAKYQGTKVDNFRDEEPGKIMHELRRGEFAHLDLIPQTPYYGTVDATPLYLLLMAEYVQGTGDLALFSELRETIERALKWMDDYGNISGRGYLEYQCRSEKGLRNQGWKDSGDGIMNGDGTLCEAPIALVEVQGYVYAAKLALAGIFEKAGESSRATWIKKEAEDLRIRFNHDFWLEENGFYTLCLQKGGQPASVITSNPGQALWAKIVTPMRARAVVSRLMQDDMFTGWGVRTLSEKEKRYNPIGYHLGSIWPHDNAFIAAGFRHYGFDDEATQIFEGLLKAASFFEHFRLPELFSGFSQKEFGAPVQYPVACHPQAWAASTMGYLLLSMLGLEANAFEKTLRIVRPVLPENLSTVEISDLRVGKATVDLRFERMKDGTAGVSVQKVTGQLEVVTEKEAFSLSPQAA